MMTFDLPLVMQLAYPFITTPLLVPPVILFVSPPVITFWQFLAAVLHMKLKEPANIADLSEQQMQFWYPPATVEASPHTSVLLSPKTKDLQEQLLQDPAMLFRPPLLLNPA